MRVRPVVTLTIAALVLGACGSSARSAAPPTPSTGSTATPKPTVATKQATTSGAQSTPVTDLNGHQIVGVKAEDVAAESVPDKPLDRATHALLAAQLVEARNVAMRYPTVADATATGYHLVGGGFGPGSGAHYIGGGYSFNFDPNHPLALIYDGIHPTSQMVGLMYYGMGDTAPQGFAGPNDHWHRHSGVCLGSGGSVSLPAGLRRDRAEVRDRERFVHGDHRVDGSRVGRRPDGRARKGVFSHENPDLPCADGTFHTDAIGECQGS